MKVLFQHFIRFLANTFNITPSFFSGWDQTQGLMYTKPVFYRQHLQMYLKYNLCVFMSLQVYMWGGTCMCVCKGLCACRPDFDFKYLPIKLSTIFSDRVT